MLQLGGYGWVLLYEALKTFTNVSSSPCSDTNLGSAISAGDYPTKEARREPLTKINLNKVAIDICRVVDIKLSGVNEKSSPKLRKSSVSGD
jgi:hypothetical protein